MLSNGYIWRVKIHKVTTAILAILSFLHIQKLEIFIFYVGTSKILDLQNFPPREGVKIGHFFSPRHSCVN